MCVVFRKYERKILSFPSAPPVRLPSSVEGESDDDVLDTEDELEGIPELTLDLEEELAGSTRSSGLV